MAKAEKGTQKWLANKMKSKGLQRLRWYCQMCQKQCRDENGFKCHRMSESHQRNIKKFAQSQGSHIDKFSNEFESSFMTLMRTQYRKTKVLANTVYSHVIADKDHVHMNATKWLSLTEFCHYLESTEKCYLTFGERGPILEFRDHEEEERKRRELENVREEANRETMEIDRLRKLSSKKTIIQEEYDHSLIKSEGEKVQLKELGFYTRTLETKKDELLFGGFEEESSDEPQNVSIGKMGVNKKGRMVDFVMNEHTRKRGV